MADSVVSFLLDNLSQLLLEEVKLLSGVNGKVTSLVNELKFINIFLKSSQGKRHDPIVKELVTQIRDAACEAEDVVDTYMANLIINKRRNIFGKLFHCLNHGMMLHDVNAQIESIKSTIDEIYKNKERYGIGEGEFRTEEAAESIRKRRETVEEEEVVGFDADFESTLHHLSKLRTLKIWGLRLSTAHWLHLNEFQSITKITLYFCESLNSDIMNALGQLTKLQILKLRYGETSDGVLKCAAQTFPELQVFQMTRVEVKRWILEEGAMPRLRLLKIEACVELTELPRELWCLPSLQEVNANWVSEELENHLQSVEEEWLQAHNEWSSVILTL